jgi:hypothetical protein
VSVPMVWLRQVLPPSVLCPQRGTCGYVLPLSLIVNLARSQSVAAFLLVVSRSDAPVLIWHVLLLSYVDHHRVRCGHGDVCVSVAAAGASGRRQRWRGRATA